MNGTNSNYSRTSRKKRKNRGNQLLNIMIGLVVVLIVIVGANIFIGSKNDDSKDQTANQDAQENIEENSSENDADTDGENGMPADDEDQSNDSDVNDESTDDGGSDGSGAGTSGDGNTDEANDEDTITIVPNDEEIIDETIINNAWQPIGTVQTGDHISIYEIGTVDWDEKKKAIAYATGFPEESLIYWKIKNGGGPQKSIGIVSTRDEVEKFRVYLEWVDEKGWQPVKMDILNTLDFEY
ncbi:YrrS family protein [Sporosarcina thermotolerans]|uniref:YrrS family protein n=1 Tax=Sporosarcina thermotolerans TaxID=633404 RepID=A0AAW9A758_9BACL|nr:YrrS family protein [Sporosarcina thermotolerans]MDW0117421.1 YrrS family protein [Sporosarcina thermotolerans]WHT47554.1 YrrS family protein [Sporosarcina thermotolerans]